jgi:hypothetical protein
VIKVMAAVNGWSEPDAALYLEAVFETWTARSRHEWTLGVSTLASRYEVDEAGLR